MIYNNNRSGINPTDYRYKPLIAFYIRKFKDFNQYPYIFTSSN